MDASMKRKVGSNLNMNKKIDILTVSYFNTAIKLALKRGGIDDFNVLVDWYLEDILQEHLKKIRCIGKKRIEIIETAVFIFLYV